MCWGCGSVAEGFPSMLEALGLILSTVRYKGREGEQREEETDRCVRWENHYLSVFSNPGVKGEWTESRDGHTGASTPSRTSTLF